MTSISKQAILFQVGRELSRPIFTWDGYTYIHLKVLQFTESPLVEEKEPMFKPLDLEDLRAFARVLSAPVAKRSEETESKRRHERTVLYEDSRLHSKLHDEVLTLIETHLYWSIFKDTAVGSMLANRVRAQQRALDEAFNEWVDGVKKRTQQVGGYTLEEAKKAMLKD